MFTPASSGRSLNNTALACALFEVVSNAIRLKEGPHVVSALRASLRLCRFVASDNFLFGVGDGAVNYFAQQFGVSFVADHWRLGLAHRRAGDKQKGTP